jgi:hypothetical protein
VTGALDNGAGQAPCDGAGRDAAEATKHFVERARNDDGVIARQTIEARLRDFGRVLPDKLGTLLAGTFDVA